jgi:tRNA A-37 threonylcarbamoyl transferase component Bud32
MQAETLKKEKLFVESEKLKKSEIENKEEMDFSHLVHSAREILGLSINHIDQISTGTSDIYAIISEGKNYILKTCEIRPSKNIGPIKSLERKLFEEGLPHSHRDYVENMAYHRLIHLEASVLEGWEKHNISSPRIISSDYHTMILMEHINGKNYAELLEDENYGEKHHQSILDRISKIRSVARKHGNRYLLHNDLHIRNFMFDEDEQKAKAIDPGLMLNPHLSFKDTDSYLNLLFCYSLSSEHFTTNPKSKKNQDLLKGFIETLDKPTRDNMLRINKPVSPAYLQICKIRDKLSMPGDLHSWWSTFSKDKYESINNALSSY